MSKSIYDRLDLLEVDESTVDHLNEKDTILTQISALDTMLGNLEFSLKNSTIKDRDRVVQYLSDVRKELY
jgi:hypothetical protein